MESTWGAQSEKWGKTETGETDRQTGGGEGVKRQAGRQKEKDGQGEGVYISNNSMSLIYT